MRSRSSATGKGLTKAEICNDCLPLWDRTGNFKAAQLCPLHEAAPALLEVLEELIDGSAL